MKTSTSPRPALGLVLLATIMFGCQNPYEQYYTNDVRPGFERWLVPHKGETQFYTASAAEWNSSIDALVRRGYTVVGRTDFQANAKDYSSGLRAKAKEVQADIVLTGSAYIGTQTGVIPLMTYKPGPTYTTTTNGQVNATAYGSGGWAQGSANYSGTSTTTSSGTFDTNYVPYSVQRNEYGAVFFRKYHYLLGVRWRPLNNDERKALQQNTGLVVMLVIDDTPAFVANILPGDVLLTIDGEIITSPEMLNQRSLAKAGQIVKMGILRDGKSKEIELRVNSLDPGT